MRLFRKLFYMLMMSWLGMSSAHSPFGDDSLYFDKKRCIQQSYHLQHVPIHLAKGALKKSKLLSGSANWIYWNESSNGVVYCASRRQLQSIESLFRQLDQPIQQIKVAVKIVSVDEDWLESLGAQWNLNGSDSASGLRALDSSLGLKILAELSAKNVTEKARIVASPTLIASNNQIAFIESGDKVPYQSKGENGEISTSFKDALLRLMITPTVLTKEKLNLKLNLHYDKISSFTVAGMPVIRAQQLQTEIIAKNGQLIVLGGIIESRQEDLDDRVPLLSHIPLLGNLFHYHKHVSSRKQLLIFLQPSESLYYQY